MLFSLLFLASTSSALLNGVCTSSQSEPNPIAAQYPNLTTGTINGTIAILPIPYSLARSIIPSEYGILRASYMKWLPWLGADMYPAMLQTQLDHDVGQGTVIKIPDFRRSSISYPFVDRLNDNYTHMTFGPIVLLSAQPVALVGTDAYGIAGVPATFDPPCDAYAGNPVTYSNAYALDQSLAIGTQFAATSHSPYTIDFWKNVTNQPQFGRNTLVCDNYIRLFNSTVTTDYPPTPVQGNVTAASPYFAKSTTFSNVYGLRLDNAFIENNLVSCESLKGYSGTGSGD